MGSRKNDISQLLLKIRPIVKEVERLKKQAEVLGVFVIGDNMGEDSEKEKADLSGRLFRWKSWRGAGSGGGF